MLAIRAEGCGYCKPLLEHGSKPTPPGVFSASKLQRQSEQTEERNLINQTGAQVLVAEGLPWNG